MSERRVIVTDCETGERTDTVTLQERAMAISRVLAAGHRVRTTRLGFDPADAETADVIDLNADREGCSSGART